MTTKSPKTARKTSTSVACLCLGVLLAAPALAPAQSKSKAQPQAIIAGGVYDADGFALPGIRILIRRESEKKARWEATSDARGEFAVRVPAGVARYVVATASKKHENQEQTVEIHAHERVEVLLRLRAAPRGEGGNP